MGEGRSAKWRLVFLCISVIHTIRFSDARIGKNEEYDTYGSGPTEDTQKLGYKGRKNTYGVLERLT